MKVEEKYMRRAIELAVHGELDASPNPMVGAVIVSRDGKIIGEGWHRKCGEGHAEVNAVASVEDEALLKNATMYVTLEPCSHYGKTPPCAKLILEKGIPRVVIGTLDPFDKVSGRGVTMLKDGGVEVLTGFLQEECRAINRKFFTAHTKRRPFITLKWAQSADGYIDGKISSSLTSVPVHKERALHDAILVGSNTFIEDSPRLDTRLFAGDSPRRYVLDRRGRIKDLEGLTIIRDSETLTEIMRRLYEDEGVTSLLVEGGAEIITSFINEDLWDDIRVEQGRSIISGSVKAPELPSGAVLYDTTVIDGNVISKFRRK